MNFDKPPMADPNMNEGQDPLLQEMESLVEKPAVVSMGETSPEDVAEKPKFVMEQPVSVRNVPGFKFLRYLAPDEWEKDPQTGVIAPNQVEVVGVYDNLLMRVPESSVSPGLDVMNEKAAYTGILEGAAAQAGTINKKDETAQAKLKEEQAQGIRKPGDMTGIGM